ncbi:hypothetical protein [Rhizobium sp. Root483D2]|nr:hypothetical protein [Rhizobium sp. Root483D2]
MSPTRKPSLPVDPGCFSRACFAAPVVIPPFAVSRVFQLKTLR